MATKRTAAKWAAGLCIAAALLLAIPQPAHSGIVDSFKESWSEIGGSKKSTTRRKKTDDAKTQAGVTGCLEGTATSGLTGGAAMAAQACAQGAARSIQQAEEEEKRAEQEALQRKDAAAWGQRIDRVNTRIVERQPRIDDIKRDKKSDAPVAEIPEEVIEKQCKGDDTCRDMMKAASEKPGVFASIWHWLFPGSAPANKAELKGVESDIALLERSLREIKDEIEVKEDAFYTARDVKQKSALAREKGVLISELSQASQALALLKGQQKELDSGYFAYVLMFIAAVGGTLVKKASDGAVHLTFDGVKKVATKVRRRRKKDEPEQSHTMY